MDAPGKILRKARNTFRDHDGTTRNRYGHALVVYIANVPGVKPSAVLRAFRRYASSMRVSTMPVEFNGGVFDGQGKQVDRTNDRPTAFQVVGDRVALKAVLGHWSVMPDEDDSGKLAPHFRTNCRVPYGSRDRVCPHSTVDRGNPRLVRSIQERRLSAFPEERQARAERERLNRIPEDDPESPYHTDARAVASAQEERSELLEETARGKANVFL